MADCLFCKMISGEIPTQKVAETDRVLAFRDIAPQAPTHILVIHKEHTPDLRGTNDNALLGELLGSLRDVAVQSGLSDFRVVINNGAEAGQSVFHLHVHLLAGRSFGWPPG